MNLGKKIVKLRKDNKMSQEEFAEVLNVTRQTISNWENSKNYPDIETLILISDKFNISLDILLKGDKEMIENIDNKIRKNKVLKIISSILLIIIVILIILIIIFQKEIADYIEYVYMEDITDKPGIIIGCTYENEYLEYRISYSPKTKHPDPKGGSYTVGQTEETRNITRKISEIEYEGYKNIYELTGYIKSIYEDAGATCQMIEYENIDEYGEKSTEMQFEFLDSLEEQS